MAVITSRGDDLADFAEEIGPEGPVCAVGGRTHWEVGGLSAPGTREVSAPGGIVSHQPEEMIVRVRAATTMSELAAALRAGGQMVGFSAGDPDRATIGGVLSTGRGSFGRLRYGPLRDSLLEARYVNAEGALVKAGGPLVKNVTGFDLCRLLVGSLGTLGLLAEVVLRCTPVPELTRWWKSSEDADPIGVWRGLHRPLGVLWDGTSTWVGLTGFAADVTAQADRLRSAGTWEQVEAPPDPPPGGRQLSIDPGRLVEWGDKQPSGGSSAPWWLAEIGVGTVHISPAARPPATADHPTSVNPVVMALNRAVKARFDPTGRLNPGREVLAR